MIKPAAKIAYENSNLEYEFHDKELKVQDIQNEHDECLVLHNQDSDHRQEHKLG